MKKFLFLFCFFLIISSAKAATVSDFTEEYDVLNWTKAIDAGSINTNGAPNFILLTSSNDRSHNKTYQDFTISAPASGLVSFSWFYASLDSSSKFDPFGWLLNGEFTKLTQDKAPRIQLSDFSATVTLGDVFGFRLMSTDSLGGPALAGIYQFSAPAPLLANPPKPAAVPLPAALWLYGPGLLGLLWRSKRATAASSLRRR